MTATKAGKEALFEAICASSQVDPLPTREDVENEVSRGMRYINLCDAICEGNLTMESYGVILFIPDILTRLQGTSCLKVYLILTLYRLENRRNLSSAGLRDMASQLRNLDIIKISKETGADKAARCVLESSPAPISFASVSRPGREQRSPNPSHELLRNQDMPRFGIRPAHRTQSRRSSPGQPQPVTSQSIQDESPRVLSGNTSIADTPDTEVGSSSLERQRTPESRAMAAPVGC